MLESTHHSGVCYCVKCMRTHLELSTPVYLLAAATEQELVAIATEIGAPPYTNRKECLFSIMNQLRLTN